MTSQHPLGSAHPVWLWTLCDLALTDQIEGKPAGGDPGNRRLVPEVTQGMAVPFHALAIAVAKVEPRAMGTEEDTDGEPGSQWHTGLMKNHPPRPQLPGCELVHFPSVSQQRTLSQLKTS